MYKNLFKKETLPRKIKGNASKPKELWKALKSLGLPSKVILVSQISLKDGGKCPLMKKRIITPSRILALI